MDYYTIIEGKIIAAESCRLQGYKITSYCGILQEAKNLLNLYGAELSYNQYRLLSQKINTNAQLAGIILK